MTKPHAPLAVMGKQGPMVAADLHALQQAARTHITVYVQCTNTAIWSLYHEHYLNISTHIWYDLKMTEAHLPWNGLIGNWVVQGLTTYSRTQKVYQVVPGPMLGRKFRKNANGCRKSMA